MLCVCVCVCVRVCAVEAAHCISLWDRVDKVGGVGNTGEMGIGVGFGSCE